MLKSGYKEDLSISYIMAISAHAGIDYEIIVHDADSIDGILKKRIKLKNGDLYDAMITVQLKTTSSAAAYTDRGTTISYQLKAKNYNDLCTPSTAPRVLGLLILPGDETEWVTWTEEELLLKGCMYWQEFSKSPCTDNTGTKTVIIPKTNVVNSDTLLALLHKAGEEEWP